MSNDDIEDTPGLREQMRKIADEASFSENVTLANEIKAKLDRHFEADEREESLADKLDRLEVLLEQLLKRIG